jgi:subtilisin-like proprotein convertase family protein
MKPFLTLSILALAPCIAHAAYTVSYTYNVNTAIPDNSGIGLSNTHNVSTYIDTLSEVQVQLTMSGGWSGDLYAYLTHGTGFAVLLNRPGRSLADPDGSGTIDLSVILADSASFDIHTAIPSSGSATGLFQPDARTMDPDNALDTSPRSAFLSSFNGLDPNGEWLLYVADVASGDTMTLQNWTLTLSGVPEPSTATLFMPGMLGLLRRRRVPG